MVSLANDEEPVYSTFKFDSIDKPGDLWFRITFGLTDECSGGPHTCLHVFRLLLPVRLG